MIALRLAATFFELSRGSDMSSVTLDDIIVALHTWTPLLAKPFFSIPVLQVEIAAIHSASVCGLSPRALMEFAG